MKRDEAIAILNRLRPTLQARGIAHAGVFGSVARDETNATSDVDVIVTPRPDARLDLFDMGGIQSVLEGGFVGLSVDLVVEPVRQDFLREMIERDKANAF